MKKIIITLAVIISVCGNMAAQDANYPTSIGPFLTIKSGLNGTMAPDGRRNTIAFNGLPDFGGTLYIPVHAEKKLGIVLELAYSTYAYQLKSTRTDDKYTMKYSYLTFSPNFYVNSIMLGFNFGYPVTADFSGANIKSSKLNFMAELRLAGMIPIIVDETGRLNAYIYAGYMLTGVYKNIATDDPMLLHLPINSVNTPKYTNEFNPRAISLAIGVNYLFNIQQAATEAE